MLSDTDKALLEIAGAYYRYESSREQAWRDAAPDLSATRAAQRVNALLDDPQAFVWNPPLVKRLQRLRSTRASRPSRQALRG